MNPPFTTYLDSGTHFLAVEDVPLVTAFARYPARDDETHEYAIERQLLRIEYEGAVSRAIEAGTITPLNPVSLERHTFPHGNALQEAVITLDDYKRFAASLQIRVEIKKASYAPGMIKTIAETAEYLSAYLLIDDIPDGESSPEFRLSFARTWHIPILKDRLLRLVANGTVRTRTTAGTVVEPPLSPTESTLILVGEARAALAADNRYGSMFEEENKHPFLVHDPFRIAVPSIDETSQEDGTSLPPDDLPKAPLPRQRFQEQEIIRALNELGHDPQSIPKWKAGKRGVKSATREFLKDHSWSEKVFNKAWQRLRDGGEIAEV